MSIPQELKYTESHEWIRVESDGSVTVGITNHAQNALGDIVFVELPKMGTRIEAQQECVVVESVKAAADVYAPVSGDVIATNAAVSDAPNLVNDDPYGEGWLFKLKMTEPDQISKLLDAASYHEVAGE
jgi:glycine cleavage system H protein